MATVNALLGEGEFTIAANTVLGAVAARGARLTGAQVSAFEAIVDIGLDRAPLHRPTEP